MEWLLIAGLAIWVWRLSQRTSELERQIRIRAVAETLRAPPSAETPAPAPPVQSAEPVTPSAPVQSPPPPLPEPVRAPTPARIVEPVAPPVTSPPPRVQAPPRPARAPRDRNIERWLSENGLAWLGGGALALGGIFLVAYAAQRGIFTPMLRLWAAVLLSVILLGASEWTRRAARGSTRNHPLVAALLAGAGAATLYGAVWGAHGLYGYIDWGFAALAMAAIVVLLVGLALLHGEAIGVLAIVFGILAPLTSNGAWPEDGLSLYVIGVTLTGYTLAGLRRWVWLAGVSMAGAYCWYAISIVDGETLRGVMLLAVAALGACALALTPMARKAPPAPEDQSWNSALKLLPSIGILASTALVLGAWTPSADSATMMAPALTTTGFVILAAIAVRAAIAPSFVLAASIGLLVLGFVGQSLRGANTGSAFDTWTLIAATTIGFAGFAACLRDQRDTRLFAHFAGAFGAFVLLALTAFDAPNLAHPSVWGPFAAGGALMLLAAEFCARTSPKSARDIAVGIWAVAGAALLLLTLEAALDASLKPLALAIAALAFVLLHRWRGWITLPSIALTAAALTIARALSADVTGVAFSGTAPIWPTLIMLLGGAAALYVASRAMRTSKDVSEAADALSTAALILALLTTFLLTHRLAMGDTQTPLSPFIRYSLYSLVLTIAGFSVMPRAATATGWIARLRGHVLLCAGLLINGAYLVLVLNPWSGAFPATIIGPPIVNEMALAFAAPGALCLLTAARFYSRERAIARPYAIVGALYAALWVILEIRHAFHGAAMSEPPIGLLEGNAYGLALLGIAVLQSFVTRLRERRQGDALGPLTHDLRASSVGMAIGALAVAALLIGVTYNPFWGIRIVAADATVITPICAILAQIFAAAMTYALARLLTPASTPRLMAVGAALFYALAAGFLIIRFAHHGAALHSSEPMIEIEGLWLASWPMALATFCGYAFTRGAASSVAGSVAHGARQIVSVSIWFALGFMVLGACVLFAPWWGPAPAHASSLFTALLGLMIYLAGAALAAFSTRLPITNPHHTYVNAATLACVTHMFVAVTLTVRRSFRGADMSPALREASLETWTYSAVWALFSAIVLWIGTAKNNALLRWTGLALFLITTAKVFLIDMARLDGVIRAASFLGLGGVLVIVALAVRRNAQRVPSSRP